MIRFMQTDTEYNTFLYVYVYFDYNKNAQKTSLLRL